VNGVPGASAAELLTCPECGSVAMVTVNRRDAHDFCRNCDYPLFWVPSRVVLAPSTGPADQSLRRLPGTVGRATIASLTCPHCAEPNAVSAVNCVRCGQLLRPVAVAPPPEPVYVAPPAPDPVVDVVPDRRIPWWVWALVCVVLAGLVALVTILLLRELT